MHTPYVAQLAELVQLTGCDLDLDTAQRDRREAGTLDRRHTTNDLDRAAEGACALLAAELGTSSSCRPYERALQVKTAARLALALLPDVIPDWDGRFRLGIDADGVVPQPGDADVAYQAYADRLRRHLAEHRRGDWVDPHVVAGDVANVHDLALAAVLWWELFG